MSDKESILTVIGNLRVNDMADTNIQNARVSRAEIKKRQKAEKKRNRAAAWKIWAIVLLSITDVLMFFACVISCIIALLR